MGYMPRSATDTRYVEAAGDTMTGALQATKFISDGGTGQTAFFRANSPNEYVVSILQTSTTGVDSGPALNIVSDNSQSSAMYLIGTEKARGTLKITHRGYADGSDANAAALSIDLLQPGTAAQGLYLTSGDATTTGNMITVRHNSRDDFVVRGNGRTGVGMASGVAPFGVLEVKQNDDTTPGLILTANSGSAQNLLQLRSAGGTPLFTITAPGAVTSTGNITIDSFGTATLIIDRAASTNYSQLEFRTNGTQDAVFGMNNTGQFRCYVTAVGNNAFLIDPATGLMTVLGNPTAALGISTKQYTDTKWTMWTGTQAAYDAIGTKDPSTLYVIV